MDSKTVKRALRPAENRVDLLCHDGKQPDWDDFRVFVAVARDLNFTKAGFVLGLQQSTVSRRIDGLEQSLGVTLFERTRRGLALTSSGERLFADVEEASQLLGRAASVVRSPPALVEGELKVAMSEGLASSWFVPLFLPIFSARYPRLSLRLGVTNEQDGSLIPPYDIQIRYGATRDYPDLKTARIGTFHFMHFASRPYVDRFGLPLSAADLKGHHVVDMMESVTSKLGLTTLYGSTDFGGQVPLSTNSGHVAAQAVVAGVAIGFLPSYAYVALPQLVPVPSVNELNTGIHLMFAAHADERPAVRAMINFLRNVVFNKKRMPWFADSREHPTEFWRPVLDAILSEQYAISDAQQPGG
jgi:DNA-binding transcriptional LysR family regulator